MDITPLIPQDRPVINRYGNGGFVISGVAHKGNMLLMPENVEPWSAANLQEATE